MKKIIFATNNKHKLVEARAILGVNCQIISLDDIGFKGVLREDYQTLRENASQKSKAIYELYKCDCFSDDTGLEVNALNGAPGVISARYAGESNDPDANMKKLLHEMKDIIDRSARFKTVISLFLNDREYFFEGIINGYILDKPHGIKGFGYDPVFVPEGFSTSFAQMSSETKNSISHRAIAVNKLAEFLAKASH